MHKLPHLFEAMIKKTKYDVYMFHTDSKTIQSIKNTSLNTLLMQST